MSTLKESNRSLIRSASLVNTSLFWYLLSAGTLNSFVLSGLATILAKSGVIAGVSLIGALALDGLLPRWIKEVVVHFRLRHATPGHRTFSVHIHQDSRISVAQLRRRIGEFPEHPEQQNKLWYRLYREQQNEPAVLSALKDYLLSRDIAVVAALFLVIGTLVILIVSGWTTAAAYFAAILTVEYLVFAHVARIQSVAPVRHVLAIESARN